MVTKPKNNKGIIQKPFEFQPFSTKQKKVLTWWIPGVSPYVNKDIIIADGAIRSGKTISCIDSFINWSLYNFKHQNFILAGKSIGALKRNVLSPLFQILDAKGINYRYIRTEDVRVEIGTNIYYCFGANNEASQDTLQGLTSAGAYGDEVPLFPESFLNQMIGRCSVDGAKIFLNGNPQGPKHWFKTEWIDRADEKNIYYIHFKLEDNVTLVSAVIERLKRMFTGLFYKRYILGLWAMAEGVIYDMFDENIHTFKTPYKVYDEYGVAVDYATSSVMTFGLYGISGKTVHKIKEYYWDAVKEGRQKTDSEFADDFIEFIKGYLVRNIYIDPSASSFKLQLRRKGITQVRDAENDVVNGIRLVSSFINDRRYLISSQCKHTLTEIADYVWDKKAQDRGEDKPVKKNDHCMDTDRYFIYTRFNEEHERNILDRYKRYAGGKAG